MPKKELRTHIKSATTLVRVFKNKSFVKICLLTKKPIIIKQMNIDKNTRVIFNIAIINASFAKFFGPFRLDANHLLKKLQEREQVACYHVF